MVKNPSTHVGDTIAVGLTLGQLDPLEKKMGTSSSILTWKIPWAEEPGKRQAMGL